MAQNPYIAGAEQGSGKSIAVPGLVEALSVRAEKVGFCRPVVPNADEPDGPIRLINERFRLGLSYTDRYGCTGDEARQLLNEDGYDQLLKRALCKYRQLQRECNIVLSAGIDYSRGHAALAFDFNVDVANNLGCSMIPVVRGQGHENPA